MVAKRGRVCKVCSSFFRNLGPRPECSVDCHIEANIEKGPSCWAWKGSVTSLGYGRVNIKGKEKLAHRLVYQKYVGEIPDGLIIRHQCDNPNCVNPKHLIAGTYKENTADIYLRGRNVNFKGSLQPRSKLSEDQVLSIRSELEQGHTQSSIGKKYNIHQTTVCDIKRRKNWAHI